MEIDWKYDDIRAEIKISNIVTFEFNGKYYTGVVTGLRHDWHINVFNHGQPYDAELSKIIARASFDDVVRPAKPKSKFPDGALTWDEVEELSYDDVFLWVYFKDCEKYYPAILDADRNGDTVIVWCASNDKSWLRKDSYGTKYVCYLNKPDEG